MFMLQWSAFMALPFQQQMTIAFRASWAVNIFLLAGEPPLTPAPTPAPPRPSAEVMPITAVRRWRVHSVDDSMHYALQPRSSPTSAPSRRPSLRALQTPAVRPHCRPWLLAAALRIEYCQGMDAGHATSAAAFSLSRRACLHRAPLFTREHACSWCNRQRAACSL